MNASVLAILTNYARPQNIPIIVSALRQQTHPVDIVIVDNSPHCSCAMSHVAAWDTSQIMDVWRFTKNAGPPCRFAPALMQHDHSHVLFIDDDLVPGAHAVEHLIKTAELFDNEFATLGEIGRRVHGGNRDYMASRGRGEWRYCTHNIRRRTWPFPVDITCRVHFVRADCVRHVLSMKWDILQHFGDDTAQEGDRRGWWREDDILLCTSIQRATGFASYLTPVADRNTYLRRRDLPAPGAHSSRTYHKTDRSRCVRMAVRVGWKPLWHDAERGRWWERNQTANPPPPPSQPQQPEP